MMKKISFYKKCLILPLMVLWFGCEEVDDLAIHRVAAPLLVEIQSIDNGQTDVLTLQASFYELDKSGILDEQVGIDSIAVADLAIEVYVNGSTLVGNYTTDSNGQIMLEKTAAELSSSGVLEWVGTYQEVPFRKSYNYSFGE